MTRKESREWLMKLIFSLQIREEMNEESFEKSCSYYELEDEYIINTGKKLIENLPSIDMTIEENIKEWDIKRISTVDLSILRISVCEILFFDSIPQGVSINEAIEMSKKFSDQSSYRFINGVLGSLVRGDEY